MATPSGRIWNVEIRRSKFFPLDPTGAIAVPGYPTPATTAYEGLEFARPKSLVPNFGAPRTITNVAQGRVQDTIILPSIDPKTGEYHLSDIDMETFATLQNVKTRTIGNGIGMPWGTDKQGLEINGIFTTTALVGHDENGDEKVLTMIYPKARGVVTWPAMNENAIDVTVNFSFSATKKHIWGQALTEATDGALEQTAFPLITNNDWNMVAFLADGVEDTFLLPTNRPAADDFASSMTVWNFMDGTEYTGGAITKSSTQFVLASPPTDQDIIVCLYEYES